MQEAPETWAGPLGGEDALEKEVATHSSTLAWEIPGTEEPGGLQSKGSHRVGHGWATEQRQRPYLQGGCILSNGGQDFNIWIQGARRGVPFTYNEQLSYVQYTYV